MADRQPRYASLRDYTRLVRKQWVIITVPALVALIAALAYSLQEPTTYDARSQVLVQDESQQLSLLGTPVATSAAGGPAAIVADTANTPALAAKVQRQMRTGVPAAQLMADVSLSVDASTGLLDIDAQGPTGTFAAGLANAYARAIADSTTASVTRKFTSAAQALRHRLGQLSPTSAANGGERATIQDEISRLEFLAATSTPGQVALVAQPSATPASPKPTRDGALGLLAGLLIGLIAAFVREALDGRMRNPNDVAGELSLPVLGHVRRRTLGVVVSPSSIGGRSGAGDVETFRILRNNVDLMIGQQDRRVLVVTSALPEEGKSTVAASLALASAAAGRRTLLLEADLRRPTLSERLGIPSGPGLAEYLAGTGDNDGALRAFPVVATGRGRTNGHGAHNGHDHAPGHTNGHDHANGQTNGHDHATGHTNGHDHANGHGPAVSQPGLVCVPAGRARGGSAELLASQRMRDLLADVTAAYDLVIVDTAPLLPVADTRALLGEVGGVLLCVRSGRTTGDQVQAARETLGQVEPEAMGVVVTDVRTREGAAAHGMYAYAYAARGE